MTPKRTSKSSKSWTMSSFDKILENFFQISAFWSFNLAPWRVFEAEIWIFKFFFMDDFTLFWMFTIVFSLFLSVLWPCWYLFFFYCSQIACWWPDRSPTRNFYAFHLISIVLPSYYGQPFFFWLVLTNLCCCL